MTRQHFQMIARTVATIEDPSMRAMIAQTFATELRSYNPRFDRTRFLRACGVNG